jgi:glycosyltransferase involved in cell wall biosynthesis
MVREVVSNFELPQEKVHLVPNGVDIERWRSQGVGGVGAADGADDGTVALDRPLVVAWGRIQYEKGFQVLARAIGELRQRVPGIRCVIAGRGSYLPEQDPHRHGGRQRHRQLAGFVADDELHGI